MLSIGKHARSQSFSPLVDGNVKNKNAADCSRLQLEMWANAQRDGRPAEYWWRPLFNAAKFG